MIIPIEEECKKLVGDLKSFGVSRNLLRSLQKYTVNVYENERENLLGGGNIKKFAGFIFLKMFKFTMTQPDWIQKLKAEQEFSADYVVWKR